MINSVKEYISILKVLVTKTSDYILLQTGKKSDIVSSSKPLSEIFPGIPAKENPENIFDPYHYSLLCKFSDKGAGIAFCPPQSVKWIRKGVNLVVFHSMLRGYVSVILSETVPEGFSMNNNSDSSQLNSNELPEMFRQLAENTNEIFWLRTEKEFLYINNQFEKIWGRSKEELMENPLKLIEWIYPEDISNIEPWVNTRNLIKGNSYSEHYRIIKPDGQIRWIWSRTFPVFDKSGNIYRIAGVASDITEQKEFEEALRIAKEKAQESDLLKSSFLANISHEIRTPMNGIIGFSELICREDIDPSTRKHYISIMKKSSDQLVCIIDDIIDFSKLESNQIRIYNEPFDLNRLIEDLTTFYNNELDIKEKKAIKLLSEMSLQGDAAKVISDETRLRQVLSYLLDNAIKFTSKGFIKFGYTRHDDTIRFFVQDTGLGIPADKFDHIFERFRQIDEGHTRKFGGTGLGLPISRGLINLLGGRIWLESTPGQGSTFYFTIPYQVEKEVAADGKSITDTAIKYKWKEKLILVAEDDELNYEYIKVLLEPTEAKLIRAKDGSQVIRICSNLNFDIILMDIRLPVLNGIQATKQLRDMGISTPIIAQTAFAMNDDEERCLAAGCNRYISKPINKDKLFSLIDELLP